MSSKHQESIEIERFVRDYFGYSKRNMFGGIIDADYIDTRIGFEINMLLVLHDLFYKRIDLQDEIETIVFRIDAMKIYEDTNCFHDERREVFRVIEELVQQKTL